VVALEVGCRELRGAHDAIVLGQLKAEGKEFGFVFGSGFRGVVRDKEEPLSLLVKVVKEFGGVFEERRSPPQHAITVKQEGIVLLDEPKTVFLRKKELLGPWCCHTDVKISRV
jgi:hypothetical protein